MPQITFYFPNYEKQFSCEINPVDRKKLYGWTEVKHFGDNGSEVKKIHLDSSGIVKMEDKSTSFQFFDEDGNYLSKTRLISNKKNDTHPSSFEGGVKLYSSNAENLLDIEADSVYELSGFQTDELLRVMQGRIFYFDFAYTRQGEYKSAYLLASGGRAFVLAGNRGNPQWIKMDIEKKTSVSPEDFLQLGEDELDFNLM